MRLLTIIWLLGYGFLAGAQTEAQIESAQDPIKKMEMSYIYANSIRGSNPQKALVYAAKAYALAKSESDTDMMINSSFLQGEILKKQNNNDAARNKFKTSFQLAGKSRYLTIALESLDQLQEISLSQNNYRQAYEYSKQSVALLKRGINKPANTPRNPVTTNTSAPSKTSDSGAKITADLRAEIRKLKTIKSNLTSEILGLQEEKDALKKKQIIEEKAKIEGNKQNLENSRDSLNSLFRS